MSYRTTQFGLWGSAECPGLDGAAYRACVDLNAYTGPVSDLGAVAQSGVVVNWSPWNAGSASETVAPILTSEATLPLLQPSLTVARLGALHGLPDGAVRLRLLRDPTGAFNEAQFRATPDGERGLVWAGFLKAEDMTEPEPAEGQPSAGLALTFGDGIELLTRRPFLEEEPQFDRITGAGREEALVAALARVLSALEGSNTTATGDTAGAYRRGPGSLRVQVPYLPYVAGDAVAEAADPFAALRLLHAALWDFGRGESATHAEAARALVSRVLGRLCQARGGWSVCHPAGLAAAGGLAVPVTTYPLTGASTAAVNDLGTAQGRPGTAGAFFSSRTVADRVQEARQFAGSAHVRVLPVREVESGYAFRPEMDDLVQNGSFERPAFTGAASLEVADGWDLSGPAVRRRLVNSDLPGFDVANLDAFVLRAPPGSSAYQKCSLPPAGGEGWRMEVSHFMAYLGENEGVNGPRAGLDVRVVGRATWRLYPVFLTAASSTFAGEDASLYIEPAGDALDGLSPTTPGAVMVPAGTALRFNRPGFTPSYRDEAFVGTLTVKDAVRVGDERVSGSLTLPGGDPNFDEGGRDAGDAAITGETERLKAGDRARAYVWIPSGDWSSMSPDFAYLGEFDGGGAPRIEDGNGSLATLGRVTRTAALTDLTGQPVTGESLDIYCVSRDSGVQTVTFDDVSLRFLNDGDVPGAVLTRAALPSTAAGLTVAIPADRSSAHLLGDGPLPSSRTRLRVTGASGDAHDTTGAPWRAEPWGSRTLGGEDAPSLDALAARDTLRLLTSYVATADGGAAGGGERIWTGACVLRPSGGTAGVPIWPDAPARLGERCAVSAFAPVGATEVWLTRAPTPGGEVTIGLRGEAVTYTAQSGPGWATPLMGGVLVRLTSGLTAEAKAKDPAFVEQLVLPSRLRWATAAGTVAVTGALCALADPASFLESVTLES